MTGTHMPLDFFFEVDLHFLKYSTEALHLMFSYMYIFCGFTGVKTQRMLMGALSDRLLLLMDTNYKLYHFCLSRLGMMS